MEYLHDPRRVGLSLVGLIGWVVELNGGDYSTGGADVQLETTTRARTLPRPIICSETSPSGRSVGDTFVTHISSATPHYGATGSLVKIRSACSALSSFKVRRY